VFLAAGVAGLYFVCTVPDARRRGIGTAISREALVGTLELGFDVGVLGSSPMGQSMYERLGFRAVCAVNVYEWSPFRPRGDRTVDLVAEGGIQRAPGGVQSTASIR
jgi:GNAT superfamily N-acetyltransferase